MDKKVNSKNQRKRSNQQLSKRSIQTTIQNERRRREREPNHTKRKPAVRARDVEEKQELERMS